MTDQDIRRVILKTIRKEGGYVNDPDDPGGETKYGISKRSFRELDIKALTIWKAIDLYRRLYLLPLKVDKMNNVRVGWKIFDTGVNTGLVNAARLAQRAVGVEDDGFIGPKTVEAINATEEATFFMRFIPSLEAYYEGIVERNPARRKFYSGWINRAKDDGEGL